MELTQNSRIETESGTIADAQVLNTLKHRVRDVTRALDASGKVYPNSLESHQLKHEVAVLLSELQIHGLLPDTVSILPDTQKQQ